MGHFIRIPMEVNQERIEMNQQFQIRESWARIFDDVETFGDEEHILGKSRIEKSSGESPKIPTSAS